MNYVCACVCFFFPFDIGDLIVVKTSTIWIVGIISEKGAFEVLIHEEGKYRSELQNSDRKSIY